MAARTICHARAQAQPPGGRVVQKAPGPVRVFRQAGKTGQPMLGNQLGAQRARDDLRLNSRGHFAVLLLSSMAGVHALRIDRDGSVKPFEVSL